MLIALILLCVFFLLFIKLPNWARYTIIGIVVAPLLLYIVFIAVVVEDSPSPHTQTDTSGTLYGSY